jgi:hypothetical protein
MTFSFKMLDQFGVKFNPTIQKNKLFKTNLGAVLSIIVYSLSALYFGYTCYLWGTGNILPKIVTK